MQSLKSKPQHLSRARRRALLGAGVALAAAAVLAFGVLPYADSIAATNETSFSFGDPVNALGPPKGTGSVQSSSDVYAPGNGGSVTLELSAFSFDGPGTDLVVYENPFTVLGTQTSNWIECFFVEVSSDGETFARFPTEYLGPVGPHVGGAFFLPAEYSWFRGFAGVAVVHANPELGVDPQHIVEGGGDAFDYADLADHPAVLSGDVLLDDIRYVRLVDVVAGVDTDSHGTPIWDCGQQFASSADVEAVAMLNSLLTYSTSRPSVDLTLRPDQVLELTLEDPDGLFDIKNDIQMALDGVPVNFYALLNLWNIVATPNKVILRIGPVPPGFPPMEMKVAVRDHAGQVSGDAIYVP